METLNIQAKSRREIAGFIAEGVTAVLTVCVEHGVFHVELGNKTLKYGNILDFFKDWTEIIYHS